MSTETFNVNADSAEDFKRKQEVWWDEEWAKRVASGEEPFASIEQPYTCMFQRMMGGKGNTGHLSDEPPSDM